ncbi:MAG: hypothetical protein J0J01_24245 [Reyranella sp.]|uniref:hypothetical protein n=1 Tax=Reyranella sp. TaxID=1929291 RepID=UPI001AD44838|nr:hypothetical protein [Reyranella sp.]MBN9090034.1 hypothetical protein [Reyranella sp.]
MQRRLLLASVGALLTAGCQPEGKVLQVSAPANAPPPRKIERVLIWLPPETGLASAKLGDAFVAAFVSQGVPARVGRGTALELNRGDDQAALMNELKATHRVEVEVASYRQVGGNFAQWTLVVGVYAGTSRTPLMALRYQPSGYSDYALAGMVVQKLVERGYL